MAESSSDVCTQFHLFASYERKQTHSYFAHLPDSRHTLQVKQKKQSSEKINIPLLWLKIQFENIFP